MIAISDPDDSFGVGVLGACHGHRHNPVFYLQLQLPCTISFQILLIVQYENGEGSWGETNCSLQRYRCGAQAW